jgi:predicted acetyltransferase/N-acetylglutamate synthase-like GNAT family acetyltransferase
MEVRDATAGDRAWLAGVLAERWGSTLIARRGTLVDAGELPGLIAEIDGEPVGLATYEETDGMIEIVTLDALGERQGVGTALVERLVALAGERHCSRVWLVTTNDNLRALRFYQRRGFRLAALHAGAVDRARALKPGIPAVGSGGLEIHDEIELAREIPTAGVAGHAGTGGAADPGEVVLERVTEPDKAVLARLLQFYRHDFSAFRHDELAEDGTFAYRFLDLYFLEPDREAWFIRHAGELAGFAMTRTLPDCGAEVAEFFVLHAHRRVGVGRRAAGDLFRGRPGRWEVAFDVANEEAARFWPAVVASAATGPVDCTRATPPARTHEQVVLRFSTA